MPRHLNAVFGIAFVLTFLTWVGAGRATVMWDDGRRANFMVGRSFRAERNDVFTDRTGLRTKASDWIVSADAQPMRGLSMFARARLDSDSLDIRRLEAGAVQRRAGDQFDARAEAARRRAIPVGAAPAPTTTTRDMLRRTGGT